MAIRISVTVTIERLGSPPVVGMGSVVHTHTVARQYGELPGDGSVGSVLLQMYVDNELAEVRHAARATTERGWI